MLLFFGLSSTRQTVTNFIEDGKSLEREVAAGRIAVYLKNEPFPWNALRITHINHWVPVYCSINPLFILNTKK